MRVRVDRQLGNCSVKTVVIILRNRLAGEEESGEVGQWDNET